MTAPGRARAPRAHRGGDRGPHPREFGQMDVVERLTPRGGQLPRADRLRAPCTATSSRPRSAGTAGARPLLRQRLRDRDPRLARPARSIGVDNDVATIDMAQATLGAQRRRQLRGRRRARLPARGRARALRRDRLLRGPRAPARRRPGAGAAARARRGRHHGSSSRCRTASCFDEENPFHLTDFGYEEAVRRLRRLPATVIVLPQFLAEGSLIVPAAGDRDRRLAAPRRPRRARLREPLHRLRRLRRGRGRGGASTGDAAATPPRPTTATCKALERAYADLRRANARLARGSGSASRARRRPPSSPRPRPGAGGPRRPRPGWPSWRSRAGRRGQRPQAAARAVASGRRRRRPDRCMNTWDDRYRRARENLIPWIESTVPLDGQDGARVRLRQRAGELRLRRARRAPHRARHRRQGGRDRAPQGRRAWSSTTSSCEAHPLEEIAGGDGRPPRRGRRRPALRGARAPDPRRAARGAAARPRDRRARRASSSSARRRTASSRSTTTPRSCPSSRCCPTSWR